MASLVQKLIVEDASKASSIMPQRIALVNPDGTVFAPTASPKAATTSKAGLVKQAAAVPDAAADADAAALAAKVNALLAALRAAGVVKA